MTTNELNIVEALCNRTPEQLREFIYSTTNEYKKRKHLKRIKFSRGSLVVQCIEILESQISKQLEEIILSQHNTE
jgi:hypothetical protein